MKTDKNPCLFVFICGFIKRPFPMSFRVQKRPLSHHPPTRLLLLLETAVFPHLGLILP
ncbi:MAG: hypothetical protein KDE56_05870 [Anaerolineales bacterium]|nr:hypothetical protein [Anaerolineales bacterium]